MSTVKRSINGWDIEIASDSTGGAFAYSVVVRKGDEIISSIGLPQDRGTSEMRDHSVILDGETLLICTSDTVFCFSIPTLTLQWKTKADAATCFAIYLNADGYIVHGELSITKLSKTGVIVWQFSGRDIFVAPDGGDTFAIANDHITVRDWQGYTYTLDLDGHEIKNL